MAEMEGRLGCKRVALWVTRLGGEVRTRWCCCCRFGWTGGRVEIGECRSLVLSMAAMGDWKR